MAGQLRLGGRGTGERMGRSTVTALPMDSREEEAGDRAAAWREARELVWTHRRRLAIGLCR